MDNPPSVPPPAIRVSHSNCEPDLDISDHPHPHNHNHHPASHPLPIRSLNRGDSPIHIPSLSSSPHGPMAIPNSKQPLAPPPLPPPRFIEDLAHGHDSGWKWSNSFEESAMGSSSASPGDNNNNIISSSSSSSTLAPIKPTSSLFGGHSRPPLVRRDETSSFKGDEDKQNDAEKGVIGLGPRHSIGEGNISNSQSDPVFASPDRKFKSQSLDANFSGPFANALRGSRMGYCLQGEEPLSQKSVERSSNAYDQHLLSKIGGPTSPPRQSLRIGTPTVLPFHPKLRSSLSSLSIGEAATLSPQDASSRWNSNPPSAAISPGTRGNGWSDYVGFRGSRKDSVAHTPMEVDRGSQTREKFSGLHGRHGVDEQGGLSTRSQRGSYDHHIFQDSDDVVMDDVGVVGVTSRRSSGRDRTSSYVEGVSPLSRHGMKRRASSPPQAVVGTDETPGFHPPSSLSSDAEPRRMSGFPFNGCTSPGQRYQSSHGSVSSASSTSLRTGSYASSAGLSVGGSSISSYDRPSPGGISPTSDLDHSYEKGFVSPGTQMQPVVSASRPSQYLESAEMKKPLARKGSMASHSSNASKHNPPRMGRLFICECCPKKPKKLDSLEELRTHEMEKQYMCHFCNKRFKNKNEAERHQNSLHLRRHSWSCASLLSYESAFHPSASPSYQTSNGPSHDTCGYCGVEFANYPQPEWDRRVDHLTNIHKFGECNQAKKFYRADHFRQHLKHSHAGSSGKWTNILENACMKEELPIDGGLPSIGEQPGGAMENPHTLPKPGTRTSHTIDEVVEES